MDNAALNPFFSQLHQAAEYNLTLQRQAGELFLAQAKTVEAQVGAAFEGSRNLFAAQQSAAQAMGRVLVDAMKPKA